MIRRIFAGDLKTSLLRNGLIASLWWIVFYPGFYSDDSFAAAMCIGCGACAVPTGIPLALE